LCLNIDYSRLLKSVEETPSLKRFAHMKQNTALLHTFYNQLFI